jgi:hypothetical protein
MGELVAALLAALASVNERGGEGRTALLFRCARGSLGNCQAPDHRRGGSPILEQAGAQR